MPTMDRATIMAGERASEVDTGCVGRHSLSFSTMPLGKKKRKRQHCRRRKDTSRTNSPDCPRRQRCPPERQHQYLLMLSGAEAGQANHGSREKLGHPCLVAAARGSLRTIQNGLLLPTQQVFAVAPSTVNHSVARTDGVISSVQGTPLFSIPPMHLHRCRRVAEPTVELADDERGECGNTCEGAECVRQQ